MGLMKLFMAGRWKSETGNNFFQLISPTSLVILPGQATSHFPPLTFHLSFLTSHLSLPTSA